MGRSLFWIGAASITTLFVVWVAWQYEVALNPPAVSYAYEFDSARLYDVMMGVPALFLMVFAWVMALRSPHEDPARVLLEVDSSPPEPTDFPSEGWGISTTKVVAILILSGVVNMGAGFAFGNMSEAMLGLLVGAFGVGIEVSGRHEVGQHRPK